MASYMVNVRSIERICSSDSCKLSEAVLAFWGWGALAEIAL